MTNDKSQITNDNLEELSVAKSQIVGLISTGLIRESNLQYLHRD